MEYIFRILTIIVVIPWAEYGGKEKAPARFAAARVEKVIDDEFPSHVLGAVNEGEIPPFP